MRSILLQSVRRSAKAQVGGGNGAVVGLGEGTECRWRRARSFNTRDIAPGCANAAAGFRERTARVLAMLARDKSDALFIRDTVTRDPELQGCSYSINEQDVDLLFRIMIDDASLRFSGASCAVSPKGLLAAEALQTNAFRSAQGFVAMSFDKSLHDAWSNGFDPALRAAGFRPFRIDIKDYVGGITDEIMAEIRPRASLWRTIRAKRTASISRQVFRLGWD